MNRHSVQKSVDFEYTGIVQENIFIKSGELIENVHNYGIEERHDLMKVKPLKNLPFPLEDRDDALRRHIFLT